MSRRAYSSNKKLLGYSDSLVKRPTYSQSVFSEKFVSLCNNNNIKCFKDVVFDISDDYGYIFDLFIPKLKIAIEIDGGIHDVKENHDTKRDIKFYDKGIITIRVKNDEIKSNGPNYSARQIFRRCLTCYCQKIKEDIKQRISEKVSSIVLSLEKSEDKEKYLSDSISLIIQQFESLVKKKNQITSILEKH
jgi:very-short-patch-repair endonuclease